MIRLRSSRAATRAFALLAVPVLAVLTSSSAAAPAADAPAPSSPAVQTCEEDHAATGWSARVRPGAQRPEPPLYAKKDAKKYGVIQEAPYLGDGSVTVETVFHVVTAETPSDAERGELEQQIADQMDVLNDSFSGATAQDVDEADTGGTDTPFRFDLVDTTWTVNQEWATLSPGKEERDVKRALRQGDSETLNVYVTRLEGGLLGFAYFPKDYNRGRGYLDGVVVLDGSLPGGYAQPYDEGDTLVHETGHWLALEHTFHTGCSASGDGVADTPREAYPQFGCPVGEDTCATPGLDPVHNFMDYVDDVCMYEFTPGQAGRMSDAWVAFRAGGDG